MKTASLFFALILISSLISAQSTSCNYYPSEPYPLFSVATPFIPHVSNINGSEGYSATFSYPGFFSDFGQVNFYYTSSEENSYFVGYGATYLLGGFNIGIHLSDKSIAYMNVNVGTRFPQGNQNNFMFSMGISYLYKITNKNKLEFSLDAYLHPNETQDSWLLPIEDIHDTRLTRGVVLGIFINHSFTEYLMLNFGTGVSFIQYDTNCEERVDDKVVATHQEWANSIIIPLGITLSFHF